MDIYSLSSLSKTYYIDNINGNDLNSGLSENQAWKTISKVNSFNFSPGDRILFKRGGIWNETLNISSSGLPGNEIYYGSYGLGDNPIITSSEPVINWKVYRDNIYVAENLPFSNIYEVYVNSKHYDLASYPNNDFIDVFGSSNTQILVNSTSFNFTKEQIVGSIVMAKAWTFTIFVSNVQDYEPENKKIILSPSLPQNANLSQGYGFYLKGKLWMLDKPREWYYDKTDRKLYIWLENNENPNNHKIRVSVRDYGVYINNKSNIIIENLSFFDSNSSSIYILNSQNITINKNKIKNGLIGITISNSEHTRITNNIIEDVLVDGINAKKGRNIDIINNTINNAGNIGNPRTSYASIFVGQGNTINAQNVTIKKNKINNSGYHGIMFFGDYITVEDNIIDRSCLVLDDCGGIYTYSFQNVGGNLTTRNKISGNIVMNSIGNCQGTIYKNIYGINCYTITSGIYLDAVSYNILVTNNIIYNSDYGIFSNDGYDNVITGNKIYFQRRFNLGIVSGSFRNSIQVGGLVKNNSFFNNLIYSNRMNSIAYFQNNAGNNTNYFANMSNNVYYSNTTRIVMRTIVKGSPGEPGYNPNSGLTVRDYNLTQWQAYSGQDLNSVWINQSCDFYDLYKINITPTPQISEILSFDLARINSSWNIYADLSDEYENFTANYLKNKSLKLSNSKVFLQVKNLSELADSKRIIIGNPNKNEIIRQIAASINIDINRELSKGFNQGYILISEPEEIIILANSTTGTFYGVISLIWLLNYDNLTRAFLIPNVKIIDWPDLEYRGFCGDGDIIIDGKLINVYANWSIFLDYLAMHKYNLWLSNPGTYTNNSNDDKLILQKRELANLMHFYHFSPFIPNYISQFSDGCEEGDVEGMKSDDIRFCGDFVCNGTENCITCPSDCNCSENKRNEEKSLYSSIFKSYNKNDNTLNSSFSGNSKLQENKSNIKKITEVFGSEEKQPLRLNKNKYLFSLLILSIFVLLLILFFIIIKRLVKKKRYLVDQARIMAIELKNKGYTKEEIKRKFVELGWDPEVVENYIFQDNF